MDNLERVLIIHDGKALFPNVNCNQKGFQLNEAKRIISDCNLEDAYIVSIKDEIKKYGLKGIPEREALLDPECYDFDTWNNAYIDRNINVTNIPIHISSNDEYEKRLNKEIKIFIKELERPPFVYDKKLMDAVKTNCNLVEDIFKLLKDKRNDIAESRLEEMLNSFLEDSFIVNTLDRSYSLRGIAPYKNLHTPNYSKLYNSMMVEKLTLFRVRTKDKTNTDTRIEKIEDIVHLPYKMAKRASNMRFSSLHCPCLYLGTTTYICAKECRWEEKQQDLYGSVFVPNKEGLNLKILNLTLSQYLIDGVHMSFSAEDIEDKRELQRQILKLYPLVLAISFSIEELNRDIKNEYLISQCLMKVINKMGIDGVAYLSVQGDDEFQYPHGVNLAFPAYDISKTQQYSKYCQMFEISEPVCFNNQDSSEVNSYINTIYKKSYDDLKIDNFMSKIFLDGKYVFYGETKFGKFDNYLCSLEKHRIEAN